MFYKEQITYVGLSFGSSFDALNAYKALCDFFDENKNEDVSVFFSVEKTDDNEHICASKDGYCNHVSLHIGEDRDPPKGFTEPEFKSLLSQVEIKGANIAISSKKEMKFEDFIG